MSIFTTNMQGPEAVQKLNELWSRADHIYPGTYAEPPTVRPDGSPIQNADRYISDAAVEYIRLDADWVDYRADAAASAAAAAASEGSAGTSEENAADSAANALAAQNAAESARDAAMLSYGVYSSVAAGIAATISGHYFSVPSSDTSQYLILYRNDAGVGTEVRRYPAVTAVPSFKGTVAASASLATVTEPGVYCLAASYGYTDMPGGIDSTKIYNLFVWATVDYTGRWRHQEISRFDKPEELWVRRLDTTGSGSTPWYYIPTVRPLSVGAAELAADAVTTTRIANSAVTRDKLASEYDFHGVLTAGDANSLSTSGNYLITVAISNLPAGATTGYLIVRAFNNASFVLQDFVSLTSPGVYWRRYIRPGSATYGDWQSLSMPSTSAFLSFKGAVATSTSLATITAPGNHYLTPSAGYTDLPSGVDTTKAYNLFVWATVDNAGRWFQQELCRQDKPEEVWVRRLDTTGAGTTTWYYIPTVRALSVGTSHIQASAITNSLIANKAVTRGKLSDEYDYQGTLAAGDANTLSTSGTYLVTGALSNMPAGAPSTGYLVIRAFNSASFVLQEYISLTSPGVYWRRYIRPNNATYGDWQSLAIPTSGNPLAGKNVVFFGDSITEFGDYPARVGTRLGVNATEIGFGGCRMGKHSTTTEGLLYDKMCMYNLARYINTGDYSELLTAADSLYALNADDNRPQALALSAINWSTTDIVVIAFGTNDWAANLPLGTSASADGTTFRGAINYTVDKILSAHPHLKLAFVAPMWRARNVSGDGLDADTNANTNGDFLIQFTDAVVEQANLNKLPALDMYRESGINKYNHTTWLADGLHPVSGAGYQLVADKVAAFLMAKF